MSDRFIGLFPFPASQDWFKGAGQPLTLLSLEPILAHLSRGCNRIFDAPLATTRQRRAVSSYHLESRARRVSRRSSALSIGHDQAERGVESTFQTKRMRAASSRRLTSAPPTWATTYPRNHATTRRIVSTQRTAATTSLLEAASPSARPVRSRPVRARSGPRSVDTPRQTPASRR